MRIGIQLGARGHSGKRQLPTPRWDDIRQQVEAAERAGFDLCCIEDALMDGGLGARGYWEASSLAGAVAASSARIGITHSMLNPPLRSPALIAKMALTLDEISGGRYTVGIGAGNTPEDHRSVGVAADHRYSRAAETVEIVHDALKDGAVDFTGTFHRAQGPFEPRGPRDDGPPLVVGASGPKMIRLAVRFADGWNTWSPDAQTPDAFRPMTDEVDRACEELGRDPATLTRSVDVAVDPRPLMGQPPSRITPYLVSGDTDEVAERLLAFGELGIDEVRCMIWPDPPPESRPDIAAAMAPVVGALHAAGAGRVTDRGLPASRTVEVQA